MSNGMFPVYFNGKEYNEKDCDDLFLSFYTCVEALNSEGGVYVSEGMWTYPDGSTGEW